MFKKVVSLAVVLGLLLSAFAFFSTPSEVAAQASTGKVRVAHLSPDAPAVDVYVDGAAALTNVPFKTVSNYLDVPAGARRFEVRPAGAAATSAPVINATATVEAGKAYTVGAVGLLAGIRANVWADDLSAAPSGQSKVRVYHASPDAPAVDVAPKGAAPVVSNLAFPNASGYLNLPAGSYDLEVRAAGTTTVALALNGTAIPANKIVSVFAADKLATLGVVVTAVDPVAAQGGGGTTPTQPPASGVGGLSNNDALNFGLIAVIALAVLALAAGGTALARRSR
jgi:Domain of unknown function (DUF4397)